MIHEMVDSHPARPTGRTMQERVAEQAATAAAEEPAIRAHWARTPVAVAARAAAQLPLRLLLGALAPATVSGHEALDGLAAPALFVANHTSHLDTPVVLGALPGRWRRRVAVAAAADYFFSKPWLGAAVAFLFNAFPFARGRTARGALDDTVTLLAGGWSVLLYPEGTRSTGGQIGRFRPGVGLLACALAIPVVPIWVGGLHAILPKGRWLPRPRRVAVRFGPPLRFPPGTSPAEAAAAIEAAVRALAGEPGADLREEV